MLLEHSRFVKKNCPTLVNYQRKHKGTTTPAATRSFSRRHRPLTQRLQQALALLDIRVLDHLIVAQGHAVSLAQRGLMPLV